MTSTSPSLAVIGAGPSAVGLLDRLAANADQLAPGQQLRVHLVDPHPPGGGRVWRSAQPELLWANSLAADITVLPDRSVTVAGSVGEGTTLWQWVQQTGVHLPGAVGVEARRLQATSFPSRPLVSAYLAWVLEQVSRSPALDVHLHATRAVDLRTGPDGARVVLADGRTLDVDAVVLAQGHLDARPTDAEVATATAAAEHGLAYVPTGYTADLDLSALQPGQDVLVRGAGLAFIDLMVLLTGGRGGTFTRDDDHRLVYRPSGAEPVLHVGSRRGVPYRCKLDYVWAGPPVPRRFFTPEAVEELFGARQVDLRTDLAPLISRELGWAHYTELFRAHPERTTLDWPTFAAGYEAGRDVEALVAAAVPDPADRFDLAALDRPLAGTTFPDAASLQEWERAHVRADLARAADPRHSPDAAVFTSLLFCHGTIAGLVRAGRLTPRSERRDVSGWWMNLFSYLASGPPSPRLEELLALSEAGVVRFLGADTQVQLVQGAYRATSASHGEVTTATALVDARVPDVDLARTTDPLLTALQLRGVAAEKAGTGRLHVDDRHRVVGSTGRPQDRLFAIGFWTSGGQVAAFARPRTDAPFFAQNDGLARTVWGVLAAVPTAAAA